MEKGQISVQTENIFPIIKKFLYSDQEIFLRELISNATDATSKLKTLSSRGEVKGDLGELTIDIIIDEEAKTLTIRDRGIGMSESEVKKYLNQVAFSSAESFLKKYKDDASIIGHFGLGFYSAFMVSDHVEVVTRSHKKSVKAVRWICDGNPEYEIENTKKEFRGTDVILHINKESEEYLQKNKIEELLNKYSKFLPFPVRFGTKKETNWEGEGDDRKSIETEVDNIINDVAPLWKESPNNITDEQYKEFYKVLHPFSPDPLFWIHLNIDYPFNLTGILYFPKLNNNLEVQKSKIQLYSNQVYVTDNVKDIVPEFLTLLHGVIDSPDIPLNVSRSYLQSDRNVKKITSYITKKVAEKLNNLFVEDRKAFEDKWKEISVFVKYGMISEDKFYDKAVNFALLKNIDGEHFTFEEYKDKISPNQTDKNSKVVHLYSNNKEEHYSYINSAKEEGYDVLEFDTIIDNHFIQQLEHKLQDVSFVRVDSDTVDNLVQSDEKKESVLSEKDQEKVKSIFEKVVDDKSSNIELKALSPNDHPVLLTRPEFMRRMKEMQQMQGMGMGEMPDSYNVVINTNHPLVAEKLIRMKSEEKRESFADYLRKLAMLNQNILKGEALNKFIEQSLDYAKS